MSVLISKNLVMSDEQIRYLQSFYKEAQSPGCVIDQNVLGFDLDAIKEIVKNQSTKRVSNNDYNNMLRLLEDVKNCTNDVLKYQTQAPDGKVSQTENFFNGLTNVMSRELINNAGNLKKQDYKRLATRIIDNQTIDDNSFRIAFFSSFFSLSKEFNKIDFDKFYEIFSDEFSYKFINFNSIKVKEEVKKAVQEVLCQGSSPCRDIKEFFYDSLLRQTIKNNIASKLKKLDRRFLSHKDAPLSSFSNEDIEELNSLIDESVTEVFNYTMQEVFGDIKNNLISPQIEKHYDRLDPSVRKFIDEELNLLFEVGEHQLVDGSKIYQAPFNFRLANQLIESIDKANYDDLAAEVVEKTFKQVIDSVRDNIEKYLVGEKYSNLCHLHPGALYGYYGMFDKSAIIKTDSSWKQHEVLGDYVDELSQFDVFERIGELVKKTVPPYEEKEYYRARLANRRPPKYYFVNAGYLECNADMEDESILTSSVELLNEFSTYENLDYEGEQDIKSYIKFLDKNKQIFKRYYINRLLDQELYDAKTIRKNSKQIGDIAFDSLQNSLKFFNEFEKRSFQQIQSLAQKGKKDLDALTVSLPENVQQNLNSKFTNKLNDLKKEFIGTTQPAFTFEDKMQFVNNALNLRKNVEIVKNKLITIENTPFHRSTSPSILTDSAEDPVLEKDVLNNFKIDIPRDQNATKILNSIDSSIENPYVSPFKIVRQGSDKISINPSEREIDLFREKGEISAVRLLGNENSIAQIACQELLRIQVRNLLMMEIIYNPKPDFKRLYDSIKSEQKCKLQLGDIDKIFEEEKNGVIESQFRLNLIKEIMKTNRFDQINPALDESFYQRLRSLLRNKKLADKSDQIISDLKNEDYKVYNESGYEESLEKHFILEFQAQNPYSEKTNAFNKERLNNYLNTILEESSGNFYLSKLNHILKRNNIVLDESSVSELVNSMEKAVSFKPASKFDFNNNDIGKLNNFYVPGLVRLSLMSSDNIGEYDRLMRMERKIDMVETRGGFVDFFRYATEGMGNVLHNMRERNPKEQKKLPVEKTDLPRIIEKDSPDIFQKVLMSKISTNPSYYNYEPIKDILLRSTQIQDNSTAEPIFNDFKTSCENFNNEFQNFSDQIKNRYDDLSDFILNNVMKYSVDDFEYKLRQVAQAYNKGQFREFFKGDDEKILHEIMKNPALINEPKSENLNMQTQISDNEINKRLLNTLKRIDPKKYGNLKSYGLLGPVKDKLRRQVNDIYKNIYLKEKTIQDDYKKYMVFNGYFANSRHENKSISDYLSEVSKKLNRDFRFTNNEILELQDEKKTLDFINRFLNQENKALHKVAKTLRGTTTIRDSLFHQLGLTSEKDKQSSTHRSYLDLDIKVLQDYWYNGGRYKNLILENLKGAKNPVKTGPLLRHDNEYMSELNRMMISDNFEILSNVDVKKVKATELPAPISRLIFDVDKDFDLEGMVDAIGKWLNDETNVIWSRKNKNFKARYDKALNLYTFLEKEKLDNMQADGLFDGVASGEKNRHLRDLYNEEIILVGNVRGPGFFEKKENFSAVEKHLSPQGAFVPYSHDALKLKILTDIGNDLKCSKHNIVKDGQFNLTDVLDSKDSMLAFTRTQKENIERILPTFGIEDDSLPGGFFNMYKKLYYSPNVQRDILGMHNITNRVDYTNLKRKKDFVDEIIRAKYEKFITQKDEGIEKNNIDYKSFKNLILGPNNQSYDFGVMQSPLSEKGADQIVTSIDKRNTTHYDLNEINRIKREIERDYAATFLFDKALQRGRVSARKLISEACKCDKDNYKTLLSNAYISTKILMEAGNDPYLSSIIAGMSSPLSKGWMIFDAASNAAYMGSLVLFHPSLWWAFKPYWTAMVPVMASRLYFNTMVKRPAYKNRARIAKGFSQAHVIPESAELVSQDHKAYEQEYLQVKKDTRWEIPIDSVFVGGYSLAAGIKYGSRIAKYSNLKLKPGITYPGMEDVRSVNPEGVGAIFNQSRLPRQFTRTIYNKNEVSAYKKVLENVSGGGASEKIFIKPGVAVSSNSALMKPGIAVGSHSADEVFLVSLQRIYGKNLTLERANEMLTGRRSAEKLYDMISGIKIFPAQTDSGVTFQAGNIDSLIAAIKSSGDIKAGARVISANRLDDVLNALSKSDSLQQFRVYFAKDYYNHSYFVRALKQAHDKAKPGATKNLYRDLYDVFNTQNVRTIVENSRKQNPLTAQRVKGLVNELQVNPDLVELNSFINSSDFISPKQIISRVRILMGPKSPRPIDKKLGEDLIGLFSSKDVEKAIGVWRRPEIKEILGEIRKMHSAGKLDSQEATFLTRLFNGKVGKVTVSDDLINLIEQEGWIKGISKVKDPLLQRLKVERDWHNIEKYYGDKILTRLDVKRITYSDAELLNLAKLETGKDVSQKIRTALKGKPEKGYLVDSASEERIVQALLERLGGLVDKEGLKVLLYNVPDQRGTVVGALSYFFPRLEKVARGAGYKPFEYPVPSISQYQSKLSGQARENFKRAKQYLRWYDVNPGSFFVDRPVTTLKYVSKADMNLFRDKLGISLRPGYSKERLLKVSEQIEKLTQTGKLSESELMQLGAALERAMIATSDIQGLFPGLTLKELQFIQNNLERVGAFQTAPGNLSFTYRPLVMNDILKNELKALEYQSRNFSIGRKARLDAKEKYDKMLNATQTLLARKTLFEKQKVRALNYIEDHFSRAKKLLDKRFESKADVIGSEIKYHELVRDIDSKLKTRLDSIIEAKYALRRGRELEASALKGNLMSSSVIADRISPLYIIMKEALPANANPAQVKEQAYLHLREVFGITDNRPITYEFLVKRAKEFSDIIKRNEDQAVEIIMKSITKDTVIYNETARNLVKALARERLKEIMHETEDWIRLFMADEVEATVIARHMSNYFNKRPGVFASEIYKGLGSKTFESRKIIMNQADREALDFAQTMIRDFIAKNPDKIKGLSEKDIHRNALRDISRTYHPDMVKKSKAKESHEIMTKFNRGFDVWKKLEPGKFH